jgi:hypothetical protein
MYIDKSRFEIVLKRLYFGGTGLFSSGASSEQKKEYIRAVFDDAFDNYGDGRKLGTQEEWEEIKELLIKNKKDILTEKDIEILTKAIELELR